MWTKSGLFPAEYPAEYQKETNFSQWTVVFTNDTPDAMVKKVELTGFFDSDWCVITATLKDSFNEKMHRAHFETTLFIADFSILTEYNSVHVWTDNVDIIAFVLFKLHDLQPDFVYPLIEICPAVGVKFNNTQVSLPKWFNQGSDYVSTKPDPVIKKIDYVFSKSGFAEVRFDFSRQIMQEKVFQAILNNPTLNTLEKDSILAITVKLKSKEQLPLFEILLEQLEAFEPHLKFFHDHLIAMLEQPWPDPEPESVSFAASMLSMLKLGSITLPAMDITDPSFSTMKVPSIGSAGVK